MNKEKLQKITKAIESEIEAFGEVMDVSELRGLQKKLEKFLITDPVTGILNRWKIEDVLENEINRAKHSKNKFIVMMIDIDKFKRINDIHGHNAGDEVLKQFSIKVEFAFENTVGKTKQFGRWGGDEFVYVLSSKSDRQINKIVTNALKEIRKIHYSVSQDVQFPISASIGVTRFIKDDTIDSLIDRADKAMYKAKENGGNRMEII